MTSLWRRFARRFPFARSIAVLRPLSENDIFIPYVVFRMSTGNGNRQPIPSSLSDGAALAL